MFTLRIILIMATSKTSYPPGDGAGVNGEARMSVVLILFRVFFSQIKSRAESGAVT